MSTDGSKSHRAATGSGKEAAQRRATVSGPKTAKKSMATTMAAVTIAAAAVLGAPVLTGGSTSTLDSASIISSPPNSTASRIAGVQEDMNRAVQLRQLTAEQAAFLEKQLVRRIQADNQDA